MFSNLAAVFSRAGAALLPHKPFAFSAFFGVPKKPQYRVIFTTFREFFIYGKKGDCGALQRASAQDYLHPGTLSPTR
jgi:hypothetical protein